MFGLKLTDNSKLDDAIDEVLSDMASYGPDSPEYEKRLTYLERLIKLKTEDRPMKVSPDTIVMVLGNLAGILVIVAYEQKHVMTSKGLSFVMKPK